MHMSQVHKEQLTEIENALPNRVGLEVEIFGMEGIPDDVLQAHNQRVATQFQQAETERQAATGNPPAGGGPGGQPNKKPKLEASSDLKKRLAEHRAKRAEGAAAGSSYVTPGSSSESPAPNIARGPSGTGMTPISDGSIGRSGSAQGGPSLSGSTELHSFSQDEIASHAYRCWHERGCPEGSPEVDWDRAVTELRERHNRARSASATA